MLKPSSSIYPWKYGIFLSFHSEDTGKSFRDNLYGALKRYKIITFRDDDSPERVKDIAPEILKAIGESWGSIIVFSKGYAFSSWCLEELAEIVKQRRERGHRIFPIFYDVEPSDLRKQTNSVEEAFAKDEEKYKENKNKLRRWRDALSEVANIRGWTLKYECELKFIENIVKQIATELSETWPNLKELHSKLNIEPVDVYKHTTMDAASTVQEVEEHGKQDKFLDSLVTDNPEWFVQALPTAALSSKEDISCYSWSAEEDLIEGDVNEGEIIPLTSEASVEIWEKQMNQHGDTSSNSSSHCIFRTPFPELEFQEPQLVCIGPYHRGKNLPLEKYKYFFLDKFMSRTRNQGKDLSFYVKDMMALEWRTRRCYSEDLSMSGPEFVEIMLVDACFIMEVLRHFGRSEESKDGVFPIEPWQIPILVLDLLMLENQIPFFVLEKLFDLSESEEGTRTLSVTTMALKFFDLAFPVSMDFSCKSNYFEANHLLDLFLEYIRPSSRSPMQSEPSISKGVKLEQQCDPPPPVHLIRSVMELRTSDIEFWPRSANRFTDINFKDGVLEIPPVTINDHFVAILINCMAFEHYSMRSSKDLTAYVSFMSSLIRDSIDAELLCSNGIISRFSNDDKRVADSFHLISENISNLDIQDSYLSKTLKETESYYTRIGKTWWLWRFFQRYSGICLFCITNFFFAFNRLRLVANLMIQEVKLLVGSICVPLSQGHGRSSFMCDAVFLIVELIRTIARPLVTSPVLVFCFLVGIMVFMGSKAWLRYSLNISEQSVDDSTGLSCSSETAMEDKKGSKVNRKCKETIAHQNKRHEDLDAELNPNEMQDRSKDWWYRCNHQDFPEEEFRKAFRMSKATFAMICQELEPTMMKKNTMLRDAIPVRQRVAVCIWRLATGEPLSLVSKRFGLEISTCHKLVLEVCSAIKTVLMPKFLQWPGEKKMKEIKQEFEWISGIPNVGGSMYTTHVPIIARKVSVAAYFSQRHTERNQKTRYSIKVQGVVDPKGIFTDVCIGWPGSRPDAQVLEKSALFHRANKGGLKDVWIVGNSGYPLMDWVLVPYTCQNLTWSQHCFNEKIDEIQNVAKEAFARLKGRWSCLQKRIEGKLQELPMVLEACCVLHNICEMNNEGMDPQLQFELFDDKMIPENKLRSANAVYARDHIAHNLLHLSLRGTSFL